MTIEYMGDLEEEKTAFLIDRMNSALPPLELYTLGTLMCPEDDDFEKSSALHRTMR